MSETNKVIIAYKKLYPGNNSKIEEIAMEAAREAAAVGRSSDAETAEMVEAWLCACL